MQTRVFCWMTVVGLAVVPTWAQTPWYVDDDAPPGGDGTTWNTAYTHLQDALGAASSGDEIWVATGTYNPDARSCTVDGDCDGPGGGTCPAGQCVWNSPREQTFQLLNGVALLGGYAGCGAPDPAARDIAGYETILSGDLASDDGPGFANNDENSYHVVTASTVDETSRFDGFTVTGGNADGAYPEYYCGGGMKTDNSSLTVTSCTFRANQGGVGGGIWNYYSAPAFLGCAFIGNTGLGYGGGIFNEHSSPSLSNCVFYGNSGSGGGGMLSLHGSRPTLTSCIFAGNSATDLGGAIFSFDASGPTLTNCVFSCNTAGYGGGAMANGEGSNPTLTNCSLSGNMAAEHGGGIFNFVSTTITLTNCILWGNVDQYGKTEFSQITYGGVMVDINYSCVQGWSGNLGGIENMGDDPLFVDADGPDDVLGTEDDNLRLSEGSPCIDAGSNDLVPEDESDLDQDGDTTEKTPLDLAMGPRHLDDLTVPDEGVGPPPVVDMGAYEFAGQIDHDGSEPPPGVIDARQPHPPSDCSLTARQGIGYGDEPITIAFDPPIAGADDVLFWDLSESGIEQQAPLCPEPDLEPNEIVSVSYLGDGDYEIELERPISAGFVTTISLGKDHSAIYASLPADVSSDCTSAPADILYLIDCLNGVRTCEMWQCDVDRSAVCGPPDILRVIDLLNGAGCYDPWLNVSIGVCPSD